MKIVSVKEMQEYEAALFKSGLNADVLMENAGRLCAQEILNDYFADSAERQVTVFCGPGNNGGDGLVLARYLAEHKVPVVCYIVPPAGEYKPLVMRNLKRTFVCHTSVKEISAADLPELKKAAAKTYMAVDALLGLGAAAREDALLQEIVDIINGCQNIVSIDGPTGLDMDDGSNYLPRPVRARQTYTLGFAKKGLVLPAARQYTGKLKVLNIFQGLPLSKKDAV